MKSPCRDDMDRARTSGVSAADLDGIPVIRRDIPDLDGQIEAVPLAGDIVPGRTLPVGGCDWGNIDVMEYVRLDEHLDARRFGVFPVDGRLSRTNVAGKSQVTLYGAWNKRSDQWGKPSVHRSRVEMDMPILGDRDELDYVQRLDAFLSDRIDGKVGYPSALSIGLFG